VSEQDELARAQLSKLPGRDSIAARLKELFYVENMGTPRRLGGRLFYPRREATKEKFAVYWREGKSGAENVLLDPNTWSADGSVSLGVWSVSYDGRKVAYTVKGNNSDEASLYVMDVATGAKSGIDVIEGAKYAWPSWTPAGDGFYYTWLPLADVVKASDRPGCAEVRFHKLGDNPHDDKVIRDKTGDPGTFISATVDRSGRWLIATIEHGWTRTDVYVRDLHPPDGGWKPLVVGKDARYDVSVDRGRFFVSTNEGAPNYRVLRVDPTHMDRERWVEIVAERSDATLEGVTLVGHHLSLAYLKDVTGRLELRDTDGKLVREVPLPGLGSVSPLSGEADDDVAYYSFPPFTSSASPSTRRSTSPSSSLPRAETGRAFRFSSCTCKEPRGVERRQPCSTAMEAFRPPRARSLRHRSIHGSSMAAYGWSPTCAAEASTEKPGTVAACATRSNTFSTTISPSPRSSSGRASPGRPSSPP